MNKHTIIPSELQYQSAPSVDQKLTISLDESPKTLVEYDRNSNVSLAQVFEDERNASSTFRPTFKFSFLYENTLTGTTSYLPFQYNLYYVDNENSTVSGIWKGFPQFFEFDVLRTDIDNQHIGYKPISAYSYNWSFYLTYPSQNDYNKKMQAVLNNNSFNWIAKDGIPFVINNTTENGNQVIAFECIAPHGLTVGESVELSINYGRTNIFQVYSLGNGILGSDITIFNIFNIGYTGNTFNNSVTGTFKRVINSKNIIETKSEYYVRQNTTMTSPSDAIITKTGFEKNPFLDEKKFEFSSITPNNLSRVSQKTSSNTYSITFKRDIDLGGLIDNQKRPVSELFLTIINKGYSGYFNKPTNGVGLKQGWKFNITEPINYWWNDINTDSNSNVPVSSYTQTNGVTKTFYYNQDLPVGTVIDGDFCEWNNYEQKERVISPYYQKIKYNQDNFQVTNNADQNGPGFYYQGHFPLIIRTFSNYIEVGDVDFVDQVPSWSYFSNADQQFRWRDLYSYGYIDSDNVGVDYPFLNDAHYPFSNIIFRLTADNSGINFNDGLLGINIPYQPIIDKCE
jgi:hypothetical protein